MSDFLEYVRKNRPVDAFTREIDKRVERVNEMDRGEIMTLDDLIEDEKRHAAAAETVFRMHAKNYPVNVIEDATGLSEEQIRHIIEADKKHSAL